MDIKQVLRQKREELGLPASPAAFVVWRLKNFGPINTTYFEENLGMTREEVTQLVEAINKKEPEIDFVAETVTKHLQVVGLVSRHKGTYELQAKYTAFVRGLQEKPKEPKAKKVRRTKDLDYLEALWNLGAYGAVVSHAVYYQALKVPFRSFYRYVDNLVNAGYIFRRKNKVDGHQVTEYTLKTAGKEYLEEKLKALGMTLKPPQG
jgi:hypothetical protein